VIEVPDLPWFQHASRRRRWLAGVSGGADSVALLHLLVEHGFRNVVVCHLDHGLRGAAGAADARFVRKLAESLGLPVVCGRVDVRARMRGTGESMETAARQARHGFFAESAEKHRCTRLLLAHHADDQAETVLWNLLRGSHGAKGMRDMQRMTVGGKMVLEIHRPLLGIRREALANWLKSRGIRWREDLSNAMPVAVRNRLRNEAFPLLDEITGRDARAALVRLLEQWRDQEEITRWALDKAAVTDPQGRIHLKALSVLPPALQTAALADYLARHGVPLDGGLLASARAMLRPEAAASLNLPGGARLRRTAGRLWIDA
jgi:tRNA(Ile)-lysidine synthase